MRTGIIAGISAISGRDIDIAASHRPLAMASRLRIVAISVRVYTEIDEERRPLA
jgi:hypothetical protein